MLSSINSDPRNSLVVQWLGLSAFTAMAWVQSLVGELRSCKPHRVAKIYIYIYILE